MRNPYRPLEKKIGYTFRRKNRLRMALTHRSFRFENSDEEEDNQRLEFLGDAALGFLTAAYLYETYPELPEGELTKLRSRVTSSKPLAEMAEQCGVGEYLLLGKGEDRSGGSERPSNLTDALESILGAAYLDGGTRAVQKIFRKLLIPYIQQLHPSHAVDNPKGHLQEIAQARWKTTPRYRVAREDGPSHGREFTVEVWLFQEVYGIGKGSNKRTAQAEAARVALEKVEHLETLPTSSPESGESGEEQAGLLG